MSTSVLPRFACGEQQIKNLKGNGVFEINVSRLYDNNSPTQISNPRRHHLATPKMSEPWSKT